jgi:hypothetical protein
MPYLVVVDKYQVKTTALSLSQRGLPWATITAHFQPQVFTVSIEELLNKVVWEQTTTDVLEQIQVTLFLEA